MCKIPKLYLIVIALVMTQMVMQQACSGGGNSEHADDSNNGSDAVDTESDGVDTVSCPHDTGTDVPDAGRDASDTGTDVLDAGTEGPDTGDDPFAFPESELWREGVRYKSYQKAYMTEIPKLRYHSEKNILCYLLRTAGIEDATVLESAWQNGIECLDSDMRLLFNYSRKGSGIIKDFDFTADGRMLVTELVDGRTADDASIHVLQLSIVSLDGEDIARYTLEDNPDDHEKTVYDFSESTGPEVQEVSWKSIGDSPQVLESSIVRAVWRQDAIYLLAYTFGVKLYKFTHDLEMLWSRQIAPATLNLWIAMIQNRAAFTLDEAGNIYVVFEQGYGDAAIYKEHFGHPLDIPKGSSRDLVVSVINGAGEQTNLFVLGDIDNSERITDIHIDENRLWIAGSVNLEKPDAAGGTREWDLLLMEADVTTGELLNYHLIDHRREDLMRSMSVMDSGNFLIAGHTDYVQVDTNSQVEDSKGLIAELSRSGEILWSEVFSGPRNVETRQAVPDSRGGLFFSMTFDGPITHTCDNGDKSLCSEKAALGIVDIP